MKYYYIPFSFIVSYKPVWTLHTCHISVAQDPHMVSSELLGQRCSEKLSKYTW